MPTLKDCIITAPSTGACEIDIEKAKKVGTDRIEFYTGPFAHNFNQNLNETDKQATVKEFIKIQYPENNNRRGLGFDKPTIGNDTLSLKDAYPAPEVSVESFGHSGFTGTFVWADPKEKLVYIFLSNRVNPTRNNRGKSGCSLRLKRRAALNDSRH